LRGRRLYWSDCSPYCSSIVADTEGVCVVGVVSGIIGASTGGGASAGVGVACGDVAGRSSVGVGGSGMVGGGAAILVFGSTLVMLGNSSVSMTGSSGVSNGSVALWWSLLSSSVVEDDALESSDLLSGWKEESADEVELLEEELESLL